MNPSRQRSPARNRGKGPPGETVGPDTIEPAVQAGGTRIPLGQANTAEEGRCDREKTPREDADLGAAGGGATGPGSAEMNFPGANTGGAVAGPGPGGVTVIPTQPAVGQQGGRRRTKTSARRASGAKKAARQHAPEPRMQRPHAAKSRGGRHPSEWPAAIRQRAQQHVAGPVVLSL